ncbi:MAG: formate dehydrogenase accessory sulfurtransferase FdhD [Proteobacteria bacterium]|nr:formate dehydrogenase accessory sulfurtransferase FdhD [Pseudomonadota bacterium]
MNRSVIFWDKNNRQSVEDELIGEEPLSIRIEGKPYAVIMRTPGDEPAHAAGFCLAEGIVDTPDDIAALACCDDIDANVVTVTLTEARRSAITDLMDRRGFISQTSCGICGKEIVEDLYQMIRPIRDDTRIDIQGALACQEQLALHQPLHQKTRATHAAALFSEDFELLAVAEDVGRHNALDKAVGKLFLDRKLDRAALAVLSSRISYELVQKAARARIPIILAVSRPTSLAVELAAGLNMTLACLAKPSGLFIFCGEHRLK